ncbi:MAG TPA: NAD(P)-dependent oxidoreductase [Fibrobacteraceae bacterium]|nr:NAD(P)-dependent oxidoreductase [Fibrobacteraceae bacterium]
MKILITGAMGKCGSALWNLPHELILLDVHIPDAKREALEKTGQITCVQGDVRDVNLLAGLLKGCDAVVHLAASTGVMHRDDSRDTALAWDDIRDLNIDALKRLLDLCRETSVKRVLFASSNHVHGQIELDHRPEIYHGDKPCVFADTPTRPDSLYGASKVFGEALGRFYAETGGPRFYAMRIGSLLPERYDHVAGYAEEGVDQGLWKRDSEEYALQLARLRATWLSRRDFRQIVELLLHYQGPVYEHFFAISENRNAWFDISDTKARLGYQPKDGD